MKFDRATVIVRLKEYKKTPKYNRFFLFKCLPLTKGKFHVRTQDTPHRMCPVILESQVVAIHDDHN